MKQEQNTQRSRYERPALKTFSISVEANVCQGGSPLPDYIPGGIIDNDFDS